MSVTAIGSVGSSCPASGPQGISGPDSEGDRPSRSQMKQVMDAAAKTLGMSADDLRSALQSGQSLADVASSKGVSQDTLTQAITSALSGDSSSTPATSATSSGDLTAEVSNIINHKGGGHHHHHGADMGATGSTVSAVTDPTAPQPSNVDGTSAPTSYDTYM